MKAIVAIVAVAAVVLLLSAVGASAIGPRKVAVEPDYRPAAKAGRTADAGYVGIEIGPRKTALAGGDVGVDMGPRRDV